MLSIGKLAAGQARYYLDQAEARVDIVASIGDGIEDYYGEGAETRGACLGGAARVLGLTGDVGGDELRRVLTVVTLGPGRRRGALEAERRSLASISRSRRRRA